MAPAAAEAAEEARLTAQLAAGRPVEARDAVPESYRLAVHQLIAALVRQQLGRLLRAGHWAVRTPCLGDKALLMAQAQDAGAHALLLSALAEPLGEPRCTLVERQFAALRQGRGGAGWPLDVVRAELAEIGVISWLLDGAALTGQAALARCSYGPLARALARIEREQRFHQRQAVDALGNWLDQGSATRRSRLQHAVARWWRAGLALFAPLPPAEAEQRQRWGLQPVAAETLRQKFVDSAAAQAQALGIALPDPALAWNPTRQHWDFSPAAALGAPARRAPRPGLRMALPEDDASWVREAALAHAARGSSSTQAAQRATMAGQMATR
jgi:ring-1,2-phenylacetyl-CoA epoxidase subunit PaaA